MALSIIKYLKCGRKSISLAFFPENFRFFFPFYSIFKGKISIENILMKRTECLFFIRFFPFHNSPLDKMVQLLCVPKKKLSHTEEKE